MTLTLSEPKKEKPARASKPAADADTLRRLTARIEELQTDQFPALVEALTAEGLKLSDKGQYTEVALAGVKATATAGPRMAVANWAMAARKKIIELEG